MIKESVSPKEVVEFLNHLLEVDVGAVNSLFNLRTFCNQKMVEHPTVQCLAVEGILPQVGMLGVLNGLFGADDKGWGPLGVNMDNGAIANFFVLSDEHRKE